MKSGETLTLRFELWSSQSIEDVALGLSLSRAQGGDIWGDSNIAAGHPITLKPGRQLVTYQVTCQLIVAIICCTVVWHPSRGGA